MKASAAIYAHFSHEKKFSENDEIIISSLANRFEQVVVVSTSLDKHSFDGFQDNVRVISRLNFGYDFLSYKIGLAELGSITRFTSVLFLNSSIQITSKESFDKALVHTIATVSKHVAVGLTKSHQVEMHLQSYWLMLSTETLMKPQIRNFWQQLRPLDSKRQIIRAYEIGLSRELLNSGITLNAIYNPNSFFSSLQNIGLNLRLKLKGNQVSKSPEETIKPKAMKYLRFLDVLKPNITHLKAVNISNRYGFIKKEVLFKNPLGIHLGQELTNLQKYYSDEPNNLPYIPPVIRIGEFSSLNNRVAVCLHVFHRDSLRAISKYLRNMPCDFDVFVSTSKESLLEDIVEEILPQCGGLEITIVKNRGRDVEPFLSLLYSGKIQNYQIALKLHTKLSDHSDKGLVWRDLILEGLLGSPVTISKALSAIANNKKIGIFAPRGFYISNPRYRGDNKKFLSRLSSALGFEISGRPFIAGTMFWFRPQAFAVLKSHSKMFDWFETESGQVDGTFAHALERSFHEIAVHSGYIGSCFEAPERQVLVEEVSLNSIPTF